MEPLPENVVAIAREMLRQSIGEVADPWDRTDWEAVRRVFRSALETEGSPFRLDEVLRLDAGLDLPFDIVRASYERLFDLGATDIHTRLCYARYLQMHGPPGSDVVERLLYELEAPARVAGLWRSPVPARRPEAEPRAPPGLLLGPSLSRVTRPTPAGAPDRH
jgi:hypothetical protein